MRPLEFLTFLNLAMTVMMIYGCYTFRLRIEKLERAEKQ